MKKRKQKIDCSLLTINEDSLRSQLLDKKQLKLKFMKKKTDVEYVFTRERKMGFKDFIWYLTFQKGRTTSMEFDEYLKSKNGTYEISISKQAFSKRRLNLKPQIFIDLYKDYLIDFYENYPEEVKTYKGYHILAINGSMFEIPNTEELRENFKTQKK